jgi:hypothetical protein
VASIKTQWDEAAMYNQDKTHYWEEIAYLRNRVAELENRVKVSKRVAEN